MHIYYVFSMSLKIIQADRGLRGDNFYRGWGGGGGGGGVTCPASKEGQA